MRRGSPSSGEHRRAGDKGAGQPSLSHRLPDVGLGQCVQPGAETGLCPLRRDPARVQFLLDDLACGGRSLVAGLEQRGGLGRGPRAGSCRRQTRFKLIGDGSEFGFDGQAGRPPGPSPSSSGRLGSAATALAVASGAAVESSDPACTAVPGGAERRGRHAIQCRAAGHGQGGGRRRARRPGPCAGCYRS